MMGFVSRLSVSGSSPHRARLPTTSSKTQCLVRSVKDDWRYSIETLLSIKIGLKDRHFLVSPPVGTRGDMRTRQSQVYKVPDSVTVFEVLVSSTTSTDNPRSLCAIHLYIISTYTNLYKSDISSRLNQLSSTCQKTTPTVTETTPTKSTLLTNILTSSTSL